MRVVFYMIGQLQDELDKLHKCYPEIETFIVIPDWQFNLSPNVGDWFQWHSFFDKLTLPDEIKGRLNVLSEQTRVVSRDWGLYSESECNFSISLNIEEINV